MSGSEGVHCYTVFSFFSYTSTCRNIIVEKYNTHPKVTECTAALNDWVYPPNGDRTRLMSTQPRQLPELVRRFTQDVYMCVYIQPDMAMYGDEVKLGSAVTSMSIDLS